MWGGTCVIGFDAEHRCWVLWEDSGIQVVVPVKTLWPAEYGGWVVVLQHHDVNTPYVNYRLFATMSVIAATVQKGLEALGLAPHANIQSNANWAFRKTNGTVTLTEIGRQRRKVHIHIFGRSTDDPMWADPIQLGTYHEYTAMIPERNVWPEETMTRLTSFLADEIPKALTLLH
jgi:diadenosine tetraphosphate (Ap4A) HIT family hydrolase